MKVNKDEDLIAVFIGNDMVKGEKKVTAIDIYQIKYEKWGNKLKNGLDIVEVTLKHSHTLEEDMLMISTEFEFNYDNELGLL
jgi:hypothetical protein